MDIKAVIMVTATLTLATPVQGKDIYKCDVNGVARYQEEKCDEHSTPIQLKELAAPLSKVDSESIKGQSFRNHQSSIKERIAKRQKRIKHYRKKMDTELDDLSGRKDFVPDEMNAVINHYKALIEAEQFEIKELRRELMDKE